LGGLTRRTELIQQQDDGLADPPENAHFGIDVTCG
jgi:hypothetical protein